MVWSDSLFVIIIIGLVCIPLILLCAEIIVSRLVLLAHHFGLSSTFIGMTVVSIGTSIPEIGSQVTASLGILSGRLDYTVTSSTVLGINLGSTAVQTLFLLGTMIVIMGAVTFSGRFLKQDYAAMITAFLVTLALAWDGVISRGDGLLMLGAYALYLIYLYHQERMQEEHAEVILLEGSIWTPFLIVFIGMIGLLLSSALALRSIETVVEITGISGSLIGILSLGIASALPELFTMLTALQNKAVGLSMGTLTGSGIVNPLVGIGLGAVISSYAVSSPTIFWDLPFLSVMGLLMFIIVLLRKKTLRRTDGLLLMGAYLLFIIVRVSVFHVDG